MVIAQVEAVEILRPYLETIRRVIVGAWADYEIQYKDVRHIHSITCRANIIHSHMVDRARKEFEGVEGVHVMEIDGLFLLSIQNRLVVRFKKLDNEMKSRNFPTDRQLDYLAQYDCPGIPAATRLEAGYQENFLQTGIRSVLITCPRGRKVDWYIELQEPPVTNVVELPVNAPSPKPPRRVKTKIDEKDEKKEKMTDGPGD